MPISLIESIANCYIQIIMNLLFRKSPINDALKPKILLIRMIWFYKTKVIQIFLNLI